ncbi:hypothetical protein DFH28DRAFT_989621 [Melampsora americana]|nr:hypothetical protein DFH28DRAFT_989621 [Melampsora americana]
MSSSSPHTNLPIRSRSNLDFRRIRLSSLPSKPTRMDTVLNECEVEKPEGSFRQKFWSSNQRAKRVLSRIFPSSTFFIPQKSSSLSVNVVDDNVNELGSPPSYDEIDHEVCGQSSLIPAPIHITDENIPGGIARTERRRSASFHERSHISSSPISRPAIPSGHPTRQERTSKSSTRSGSSSHPISSSRRARQARRDLQAARKSLPVLTKYARTTTTQRR